MWVFNNSVKPFKDVIRPFYPGEDYVNHYYPDGCAVIDNPPFSILSQIVRYYEERGILYFLFSPHMTIFSANNSATRVIAGSTITYANGAVVKTSFLTNMVGDYAAITAPDLMNGINRDKPKRNQLPKYEYPTNVITQEKMFKYCRAELTIRIPNNLAVRISSLDSQKKLKRRYSEAHFYPLSNYLLYLLYLPSYWSYPIRKEKL